MDSNTGTVRKDAQIMTRLKLISSFCFSFSCRSQLLVWHWAGEPDLCSTRHRLRARTHRTPYANTDNAAQHDDQRYDHGQ